MSADSEHDRGSHPAQTSQAAPPGRVLALDVGSKRIGIAISDELRVLARGLDTLHRKSRRRDVDQVAALAEAYAVVEIVVGLPLRLGGQSSSQTDKVQAFADELRARSGLPVSLWDERLTSVAAEQALGQKKRSVKDHVADRKSGAVDKIAAVIILQSYLDERKGRV